VKGREAAQDAPAGDLFAEIAHAFADDGDVTSGRMFAAEGLKLGGKIFAMEFRGRLVVKLPRQRVDELVAAGRAVRFDPGHGRLMKEWASVGPESAPEWLRLAREARAFVDGQRGAAKDPAAARLRRRR
jgi:TfoX/Sxy family transcriptional regulator of competence genes